MHKITVQVTVSIPDSRRRFGDIDILCAMKNAVGMPASSRLLEWRIISKERIPVTPEYVFRGELTFGRWFPYARRDSHAKD